MTIDWVKTTDLLDDATSAAIAASASRLNMARAACFPMTRERLEAIYDRLWTLACRVNRALKYKGRHAQRMRKRLFEGDAYDKLSSDDATELTPCPIVDPVESGHGIPQRRKRRSKRELAAKILNKQD